MTAIKQRPFAFSCCLFLALTSLILVADTVIKIVLLAAVALLATTLFLLKSKPKFLLIYVIPPLFISIVTSIFFGINYTNIKTYEGHECAARFVVLEETFVSDSYSVYKIQTQNVNGKKTSFNANVSVRGKLEDPLYKAYSSKIKFSAENTSYDNAPEYSNISSGAYISGKCTDDIFMLKEETKLFPSYYFHKINSFLSSIFDKYFGGEENSLAQALMLGNKRDLSDNTRYNFKKLGLSHMLAVSGLHLSILIASLDLVIGKLKLNKKRKYLIMITLVIIYAGMTGFSSSVKRASIMLIVYYLSFLIAKSNDSVTSLCISAALICFLSPNSIYDIGLWLSFASTYGILTVALPISEKIKEKAESDSKIYKKLLSKLSSALLLGVVPVLFSIPVIWLSYKEIAVLSPISNIIFTPFLLAIMYTCPVVLVTSFFPFIANIVSFVPYYSAKAMLTLADYLSDYSPIVDINYDFTKYIVLFLFLAILLISLSNTKKKLLYFIPFIISIVAFTISVYAYKQHTLPIQKAVYTSDRFGDSFFIISKNQGIVCDISGGSKASAQACINQAKENHISKFKAYIITNYHGQGLETIQELAEINMLDTLYLPSTDNKDDVLLKNEFISLANKHGIPTVFYDRDGKTYISINEITIYVDCLSNRSVNTADSLCVKIESEKQCYVYLSFGYDSTVYGRFAVNKIFSNNNSYIFGNYGIKSKSWILNLKYKENVTAYFPDTEVYNHYSRAIPDNANVVFTGNRYTFTLN